MKKTIDNFNSEVQKKLDALAKLEKTSKVAILKRVLSDYGGCCRRDPDDRILELTDAETRVLRKIKWL